MNQLPLLSLIYTAEMPDTQSDERSFDESLQQAERSLSDLKERYAQVQSDQQLRSQLKSGKSPALKEELRKIEQELEALEINLESRLFSWSGLKEAFWQAVRFGGLGLVLGWSLAIYTFKQPPPENSTPAIERRN